MFRFKCNSCDEWHEGMPAFGIKAPEYYYSILEDERAERCALSSDLCVVDNEFFFICARLNIPVYGADEPFGWSVWVSLSKANFDEYVENFDAENRSRLGPYFGWFSNALAPYPDTVNLKTQVYPRNGHQRPLIELEPTDHPLVIDQQQGISQVRLGELYAELMRD